VEEIEGIKWNELPLYMINKAKIPLNTRNKKTLLVANELTEITEASFYNFSIN
jgi:hypothetical protein